MKFLVEKALRRYQGKNKLLIIVLTGTSESGHIYRDQLLKHDDVKGLEYKNNIFVLNTEEFARFIGLKKNIKSKDGDSYYDKFIEGSVLYNEGYLDPAEEKKLEQLSDENQEILKYKFIKYFGEQSGTTKGWLEYLDMLKLLEVVKENPYPYDKKDPEQPTMNNFLGDK